MSEALSIQEQYVQDRELYSKYDPYYDREIELKLNINTNIDPFSFLHDIERKLAARHFDPYISDPFWSVQKSFVGSEKHQLQSYVFGIRDENSALIEVFKVVKEKDICRIREKSSPIFIKNMSDNKTIESYIIDRKEYDEFVSDVTIDNLFRFIDKIHARHNKNIEYVGSYSREILCIACINTNSQHKYAIMADSCNNNKNQQLKQLEIEYIFKREKFIKHFSKEDVYRDMALLARLLMEYYNRSDESVLYPSRLTKFAWLTGQGSNECS